MRVVADRGRVGRRRDQRPVAPRACARPPARALAIARLLPARRRLPRPRPAGAVPPGRRARRRRPPGAHPAAAPSWSPRRWPSCRRGVHAAGTVEHRRRGARAADEHRHRRVRGHAPARARPCWPPARPRRAGPRPAARPSRGSTSARSAGAPPTRSRAGAAPREVPPGRYAVVLEAPAVGELVDWLGWLAFPAKAVAEGRSAAHRAGSASRSAPRWSPSSTTRCTRCTPARRSTPRARRSARLPLLDAGRAVGAGPRPRHRPPGRHHLDRVSPAGAQPRGRRARSTSCCSPAATTSTRSSPGSSGACTSPGSTTSTSSTRAPRRSPA